MDSQTKLKRVVIKEELVILTGDHIKALILNQFLYWSERTKDFDKFLKEEKERYGPEDKNTDIGFTYGWIYKSAKELKNELMLNISEVTIQRHMNKIIEAGYIDQRHNPKHKWDRTYQYRPNIIDIQIDLEAMGYSLDGYPLLLKDASFMLKNGNFNLKDRNVTDEGAIPETTTKTTTDILENPQKPKIKLTTSPVIEANSYIEKYTDDQRKALNRLGTAIAHSGNVAITTTDELRAITLIGFEIAKITETDINTIDLAELRALAGLTARLSAKPRIEAKLPEYQKWWYAHDWRGKQGQPPTTKTMGATWGQFEAAKVSPAANGSGPVLTEAEKARLAELVASQGQSV